MSYMVLNNLYEAKEFFKTKNIKYIEFLAKEAEKCLQYIADEYSYDNPELNTKVLVTVDYSTSDPIFKILNYNLETDDE